MTTKNVKLSDLVGGGGGDAESLAGRGLHASDGKLTVDTDDTLTIAEVGYLSETRYKVGVTNAVPPTTDASDGDVLTYKDSDGIVWDAPQGGGGGNPYTKVSVTPGSPYKNTEGRSAWGFDFSDQDVNISNNTYSILSTRIGEGNGTDVGETRCIDHFNIKLPADTDFPMAVVEFKVSTTYGAGVNKVKVFVGNTEIPELHEAPYSERVLVADNDTLGDLNFNELKDTTNTDPAYKYLKGIHEENYKNSLPAYLDDNLVQVHIFGNGFKIMVSKPTGVPADS